MRGAKTVMAALSASTAACLLVFAVTGDRMTRPSPPAPSVQESAKLGSLPERLLVVAPIAAPAADGGTASLASPARAVRPASPVHTVEEKPSMELLVAPPPPAPLEAEDLARSTLRSARGAFEACYEQSLRRDEKLRGRVVVEVNVQASGRVISSRIVETTLHDERVMGCISSRLRQLRFPPLGAEVELTVPFSLVPHL